MGDEEKSDHDSRTIFCANLVPEKVTEELLYELFLQVRLKKNLLKKQTIFIMFSLMTGRTN